jgi:phage terminase Nu1 subunit (DNA packaging protein)
MPTDAKQAAIDVLKQAMIQAGVSQEDADKAAPDLIDKAEKNT